MKFETEEDEMARKILVYDKAIEILTELISHSTKEINQTIQDTEGTANCDLEILAFQLLEEQIQDLQRLRGNYKKALAIFKLHNIQLKKEAKK